MYTNIYIYVHRVSYEFLRYIKDDEIKESIPPNGIYKGSKEHL